MNQERMKTLEHFSQVVNRSAIATLTTMGENHSLHSRPMVNVNQSFDGVLWFLSYKNDPKTREVVANPNVNVSFSLEAEGKYLSLAGTASVQDDERRVELLWNSDCDQWLSEGANPTDFSLLRVEVSTAEYWDAGTRSFFDMVRHAVTGSTQATIHEKVSWADLPSSSVFGSGVRVD